MLHRRKFFKRSILLAIYGLLPSSFLWKCQQTHRSQIKQPNTPDGEQSSTPSQQKKHSLLPETSCSKGHGFEIKNTPTSDRWQLTAQKTRFSFFDQPPIQSTIIWSFTKNDLPCPILLNQNQPASLKIINRLEGQKIGVHWHGIRVPNNMDGVPGLTQPPIHYLKSFTYTYTPPDAGTFLYRVHTDDPIASGMGLTGPLIVKEKQPYPVDSEQIIFIQDWRLNTQKQIRRDFSNHLDLVQDGRLGNTITVNGKVAPNLFFRPGARVRFRVINASQARIYLMDFPSQLSIFIIARDGYPIKPQPYRSSYLGPGMRLDLLIDFPTQKKTYLVKNRYQQNSYLFRMVPHGRPLLTPKSRFPESLPPHSLKEPNLNKAKRINLYLKGGAMSLAQNLNSVWSLTSSDLKNPNSAKELFSLKLGQSYRLRLTNQTFFSHPVHFHGHPFKVLAFNQVKLPQPFFSDTVLLRQGEKVDIALVADNPGRWMIDCQIAAHRTSGMSGVFEVR